MYEISHLQLILCGNLNFLQDAKCNLSSPFRIRLTYTHSEVAIKVQMHTEKKEGNKRIKTGMFGFYISRMDCHLVILIVYACLAIYSLTLRI